jgi:hypothetical protein
MSPDEKAIAAAEHESLREPEDDQCDHHWVFSGRAGDGTEFYRCSKCREESE